MTEVTNKPFDEFWKDEADNEDVDDVVEQDTAAEEEEEDYEDNIIQVVTKNLKRPTKRKRTN